MRIWIAALYLGCTSEPDETPPTDTGPETTTPIPEPPPPPELGEWDENEPVGLIRLEPSGDYLGPVTVWWQQRLPFDVRIDFRIDGEDWQSSPVYQGVAGLNRQSIIGIPVGGTAEVRLVGASTVEFTTDAGSITTPALPDTFPPHDVQVNDPEGWAPNGQYYLTSINEASCGWCTGRFWTFIADRQGTVYWATRSPDNRQVLYVQISVATGDHVLWDEVNWGSQGQGSLVHRTYLDEPIAIIETPGHHHAFLELPDGTLAWGDRTSTQGEAIVELAPGETQPRTVWTCRDWFEGGCRSNSLYYDPAVDRYWFSFYTQSAVVEVDRATGETVWSSFFSSDTITNSEVYDFDPIETEFDWQHGVVHLDNGNLLISTDRIVDEKDGSVHTVLAEYEIDRKTGVLREVWNFDPGYDARFNGETRRYPNGNSMHVLGARSIAYEVDAKGTVVWQVAYPDGNMLNRLEFLDDLWGLMAPPAYAPKLDDTPFVMPGVRP
ncbi:MAG: aryl-sulfate sulfotransferase [Myxococcota bacterium]